MHRADFISTRIAMKTEDGPPPNAAVVQGLSGLKRTGGTVLAVGAADAAHTEICNRFLGDTAEAILVCTEGSPRIDREELDPAAVIERSMPTRGAVADASPAATDLGSLTVELQDTIRRVASPESTTRVCFDSLRPYLDSTDIPRLVSVLDSIRETARETGSVVHFHLPAMSEAVPASLLDAADAVVELDCEGGTAYQRWRLTEGGETTEWTSI